MRIRTTGILLVGVLLAVLAAASGCSRGIPRDKRPMMIIPDMEFQPKVKAQSETPVFADGRAMRTPPAGTLPFGGARTDDAYYRGRSGEDFVSRNQEEITPELLERGRKEYDIFCAPCHDRTGGGKGLVIGYGYVPPPSFHSDRVRGFADGYLFDVITNGVRNMPAYGPQIPPADRWAIVAYLRALQRSQNAAIQDVPSDVRNQLK